MNFKKEKLIVTNKEFRKSSRSFHNDIIMQFVCESCINFKGLINIELERLDCKDFTFRETINCSNGKYDFVYDLMATIREGFGESSESFFAYLEKKLKDAAIKSRPQIGLGSETDIKRSSRLLPSDDRKRLS